MPTSAWGYITPILDKIAALHNDQHIQDILDVGCGGGKWGFLSRDLIDYYHNSAYFKKDWELNIEGVEAFPKYKTPVHEFIYDKIHYKPVQEIEFQKDYDVIFFMEVIEHIKKDEGLKILDTLLSRVRRGIFLSFPPEYDLLGRHIFEQQDTHENDFERHVSIWNESDLIKYKYDVLYFNTYFIYRPNLIIFPWKMNEVIEKEDAMVLVQDASELEYIIDSTCKIITISTIKHNWSSKIVIYNGKNEQIYSESLHRTETSKRHDINITNKNYQSIKIKRIKDSNSSGNEVWVRKVTLLF
jgi:SAM-dependent methyltransferase